jgi:hypothetical protein
MSLRLGSSTMSQRKTMAVIPEAANPGHWDHDLGASAPRATLEESSNDFGLSLVSLPSVASDLCKLTTAKDMADIEVHFSHSVSEATVFLSKQKVGSLYSITHQPILIPYS